MRSSTLFLFAFMAMASSTIAASRLDGRGHAGKKGIGKLCQADDMCKSGYCHRGQCKPQREAGHICRKDSACLSGKCKNQTCAAKAHPHPSSHPHPAPTESGHPTQPPVKKDPPTSGTLSYVAAKGEHAQLLGDDETDLIASYLAVVSKGQKWSLDSKGQLVSENSRVLYTDGQFIAALATPSDIPYESGLAAYTCVNSPSSTGTQAVLDCTAQTARGDESSFVICNDSALKDVEADEYACGEVLTRFTQLTLSV